MAGIPITVDNGFIIYNEQNYPNLTAMFSHLQVPTTPSSMSFAVSNEGGRREYSGNHLNRSGALYVGEVVHKQARRKPHVIASSPCWPTSSN